MKNLSRRLSALTWVSLFFLSVMVLNDRAAAGEKERLATAFALVEKMFVSKMFVDLAESFMESYFEKFDKPGETDRIGGNPLRTIFREEVTQGEDELKWMLAEIYAAQFSEAELRDVTAFFNSAAGKTWLDKRLIIETESEQVGLEWAQLLTQRVLKKFEDRYGEKF